MKWHITRWLQPDSWPDDYYELLGRSRFDPEAGDLLAAIHAAHATLQPYQQHVNQQTVAQARRLQLELAKAEATFIDDDKRKRYDRSLLKRMADHYASQLQQRPGMDYTQVCQWLAVEQQVYESAVPAIAHALMTSSVDMLESVGTLPQVDTFIDTTPYSETVEKYASFETMMERELSHSPTKQPAPSMATTSRASHSQAGSVDKAQTAPKPPAAPRRKPAPIAAPRADVETAVPVASTIDVDGVVLRAVGVIGVVLALLIGYLAWRAVTSADACDEPSPDSTTWIRLESSSAAPSPIVLVSARLPAGL